MIALACPHCAKEYTLPEDAAGRAARCRCGQRIDVPARLAPAADLPVLEARPRPVAAARRARRQVPLFWIVALIAFVLPPLVYFAVVVPAGAAGRAAWRSRMGVSSEHPLGRRGAIDEYLSGRGLRAEIEAASDGAIHRYGDGFGIEFTGVHQGDHGESVALEVDGDGRVVTIRGNLAAESSAIAGQVPVRDFLTAHWEALAGEPEFEVVELGRSGRPGGGKMSRREAHHEGGAIVGQWTQRGGESIVLSVR